MLELDERKLKILQAIIRTYMETGEPVGSRTISKFTDLNLSSATIRNEMSDLEEMGYIIQPHTSAGRIPSDKGYRLYVDTLMEQKDREVEDVKDLLLQKADKIDLLLRQVAKLLAENTHYASMVSKPRFKHKTVKFIQLNGVSEEQLLIIVVLDGNVVKNKFLDIECPLNMEVLPQLNFLLNAGLNGLDLTEINLPLMRKLREQAGVYGDLIDSVLNVIGEAIGEEDDLEVYTSGATNILKYPELSDKEKVTELLSTFEEKELLHDWINDKPQNEGHAIQVYIGDETPVKSMKDCSVVTATYQVEEGVYGKIGIVGPKRMDYERVVGTLKNLMQQLDGIFKGK